VRIGQERATSLVALVEQLDFLVGGGEFAVSDEVWERVAGVAGAADALDAAITHLRECPWNEDDVDLRPPLDAAGLKMGKVAKVLYSAIEGRPNGLPLFPSLILLGREESLRRLTAARARLGSG
jgi:glutamyl-tRNA synthetase